MTLLLGLPGSRKSTLLFVLAGKHDTDLKVVINKQLVKYLQKEVTKLEAEC